jgi:hypothetical protein
MDADNSPVRRAAPAQGGTVEPANRAPVAIARFQTPDQAAGERYEMRDPFAEVTYRANTMPEILAKAEQLGSTRFVAVAEDGQRTPIQKVDGEWQRGQQRPAAPERPLDPVPTRDQVPNTTNVVPMPGTTKTPLPPDQADGRAIAKIDAQAERTALVARLESALTDRYVIKRAPVTVGDVTIGRTEYRFRGDTRVWLSPSRPSAWPLTPTARRSPARWSMLPKRATGRRCACRATKTSSAWSGSKRRCGA